MTHTKGPWKLHYGQWADHSDDGGGGFHIRMGNFDEGGGTTQHLIEYVKGMWPEDRGYTEAEANAKLIAQAPALLEAAKDVLEAYNDPEKPIYLANAKLRAAVQEAGAGT